MATKKTPHQRLGGTEQRDMPAEFFGVLAAIGDDPVLLKALIALVDALEARRRLRRGKKKSTHVC